MTEEAPPPTAAAMFDLTMRKVEDRHRLYRIITEAAGAGATSVDVELLSSSLQKELEELGYMVLPGQHRCRGAGPQTFVYVVSWREQLDPEPRAPGATPKRKK